MVPIAQSDLAQIAPVKNRRVQILTSGQRVDAIIDRASAELDSRSRFARLYVPLPQDATVSASTLKPGMFADARLSKALNTKTALSFLRRHYRRVTVCMRGGTLREHRPNILGRNPQGIVIDGFDSGEGIIIGTVSGISVGMPVATIPFMSQDSERP